jgi:hypothetical protein
MRLVHATRNGLRGVFGPLLAVVALLVGCSTPEERPPQGVEKSVVDVSGVSHAPVLVTADTVPPGGILRGWSEGQGGGVLVQAMLESGSRPIGQASASPLGGRTEFAFSVPEGAAGRILVRAIDRKGFFTDKIVEIAADGDR